MKLNNCIVGFLSSSTNKKYFIVEISSIEILNLKDRNLFNDFKVNTELLKANEFSNFKIYGHHTKNWINALQLFQLLFQNKSSLDTNKLSQCIKTFDCTYCLYKNKYFFVFEFLFGENFPIDEQSFINMIGNFYSDDFSPLLMNSMFLSYSDVVVVNSIEEYLKQIESAYDYRIYNLLDLVISRTNEFIKLYNEEFRTIKIENKNGRKVAYKNITNELLISKIKTLLKELRANRLEIKRASKLKTNKLQLNVYTIINSCKIIIKKINDNMKLTTFANNISGLDITPYSRDKVIFYRGLKTSKYIDMPKIYRSSELYLKEENVRLKEYKMFFAKSFKGLSTLDSLTEMQHYFLPTRLLDVTSNPLVALYMACTKDFSSNDDDNNYPGEIIIYLPKYKTENECKYYDSDKVIALSVLSRLDLEEFENIRDFLSKKNIDSEKKAESLVRFLNSQQTPEDMKEIQIDFPEYNTKFFDVCYNAYKKIIRLCLEEKPSFDYKKFSPLDLCKSYYVRVGLINERISAQSGSFILCGLDKYYINDNFECSRNTKGLRRIIVSNKDVILTQLEMLNISQKTLMPDKDHVARQLAKSI